MKKLAFGKMYGLMKVEFIEYLKAAGTSSAVFVVTDSLVIIVLYKKCLAGFCYDRGAASITNGQKSAIERGMKLIDSGRSVKWR
ncbi:hypothetical protein [Paenibacillus planticolens]|uniref:Uncharacterized protein n=1 Tax=Paenibacillus planticolens TaxID=2654976 RepID=A0ABX1ZI76_9BACL|nr:hypothetical protein [Paenibacillus planticolens]NOU98759.1 hypothetical protein [Paenibacillus planticolens]